jgi:NlpC/P60 family
MPQGSFQTVGVVASLLVSSLSVLATAQTFHDSEQLRLVSRDEGEAIVQAAWELRRSMNPKPDCSHFVHAVYRQAGLDYEYASASDVLEGIDSFQRVQEPQPGDLVAWPGHMGIVIDREEHSFYSSVRSGFAIEDYQSAYWKSRGRARFYRYKIDAARSARLRARLANRQSVSSIDQPAGSVKRLALNNGPDSPDDPFDDPPAANNQLARNEKPASSSSAAGYDTAFDRVLVSRLTRPTREEVRAAIVRSSNAAGERLLRDGALDSQPMVVVVDEFTVRKVDTSDRAGWAEVEVREQASIQHGKADVSKMTGRLKVALRHETEGWILLWPQDRTCLRRDRAIKVLAGHLAATSRAPANASPQDLRKILKVLDKLLAEKDALAANRGSE